MSDSKSSVINEDIFLCNERLQALSAEKYESLWGTLLP